MLGEQKILLVLPGIKERFLGRRARSAVTILSEVLWLLLHFSLYFIIIIIIIIIKCKLLF